jgi:hypothetical protein
MNETPVTSTPKNARRPATFSPCRKYRYTLWREWSDFFAGEPYLMVIGLNPSTADETTDDPTIRKCVGFAKRWGFGALCMTNLFAWRDTKPENMLRAEQPIGPLNDFYLFELAKNAGLILAAWGKHGSHLGRASYVRSVFHEAGFQLQALRLNNDGSPMHPLYAPYEQSPVALPNSSDSRPSGISVSSPKSVAMALPSPEPVDSGLPSNAE